MLSLLACALTLAEAPIDQPQRLRTVLPNGAVLLVEQQPRAKALSVQLFLGARAGGSFADRHLLEHLMAVGDGTLDTRLESEGGFLRAQTLRETTVYSLDVPTGKLDLALFALSSLLKAHTWPQERLAKEIGVIKLEERSRGSTARLSEAAWRKAYGNQGSSAFEFESPTSQGITDLLTTTLIPANIAIVVSGNVEIDPTTAKIKQLWAETDEAKLPPLTPRTPETGGTVEVNAHGSAVAVAVPTFRSPTTAATLSAALALAADVSASFVTYTPSSNAGLVILGTTDQVDLRAIVAKARPEPLFTQAKYMAHRWVEQRLAGPDHGGFWRGMLFVQERDLRPETLGENIEAMTFEQFSKALAQFQSDSAVTVKGRRSGTIIPSTPVDFEPPTQTPARGIVVEVSDVGAGLVSIHALVALPSLTAAEMGLLQIAVSAIPQGSQQFPRREMRTLTAGSPIETFLALDHARVSFALPRSQISHGLALMESLLRNASLRDEDLTRPLATGDPWQIALHPLTFPTVRLNPERVREVYARVFRPENITLAIGGNFDAGAPTAAWQARMAKWQLPAPQRPRRDYSQAALFTENFGGVQTMDVASKLDPQSGDFYPRLLAIFALGGGKGSSLFRVVRQGLGLSYRQEALLSPTPNALESRLLIEAASSERDLEQVKRALQKDVDAWHESTRLRALGMAEAVLLRGNEFSPFYLSGNAPIVSDIQGATLLAGYWHMKAGQPWMPDQVLAKLKSVSLADLKAAARVMVDGSTRVLRG